MFKRTLLVGTVFGAVLALGLPFVGGGGPALGTSAFAEEAEALPVAATSPLATTGRIGDTASAVAAVAIAADPAVIVAAAAAPNLKVDTEHLAQKPVPKPVVVPQSPAAKRSGTAARVAARQAAGQSCPGNVGGSVSGAPASPPRAGWPAPPPPTSSRSRPATTPSGSPTA